MINLPVSAGKPGTPLEYSLYDANNDFIGVVRNAKTRDEVIAKLNGYGGAVEALKKIMLDPYSDGTNCERATEALKSIGALK